MVLVRLGASSNYIFSSLRVESFMLLSRFDLFIMSGVGDNCEDRCDLSSMFLVEVLRPMLPIVLFSERSDDFYCEKPLTLRLLFV